MIDGLSVLSGWISQSHHDELIELVGGAGAHHGRGDRNRIERYGGGVSLVGYLTGQSVSEKIPPHLAQLATRVATETGEREPNAISINWFLSGQRIAPHIDGPEAGEVISALSLGAPAIMRFVRKDGDEVAWFQCRPCTLVIMRGEARWKWDHEILPVQEPRISIVFRRGQRPIRF